MFTKLKTWVNGLFKKKAQPEKVVEATGWDKYHQLMNTVSTELDSNLGKATKSAATKPAQKPKKKTSAQPAPTMKAAKPSKTKSPKNSK
jgi:hypothetical protein